MRLTGSKTTAWVILLLVCGMVMPIIQVGLVAGARGGGNGGDIPRPTSPPQRPSINQPTARPTIAQPTARPTFSASFTRTAATSFSFSRTIQTSVTSFSFTRTVQTSYTFSPTFTQTTTINYGSSYTNYWYPSMGFIHYGAGYSASTGSFTLGQTLYGPNNNPCLYYDYFQFNAPAGLTISARLWTTGPPINYVVVPMTAVSLLQSPSSCSAIGALNQANTIGSTPYVYSWTAPQNGQYAIIFYSTSPYTAPIYFLPQ
jgi:hypothetical protein